jgi:hypothetical protein
MRLRKTLTAPVLRIATDGFERVTTADKGEACQIQMRTVSKSLSQANVQRQRAANEISDFLALVPSRSV